MNGWLCRKVAATLDVEIGDDGKTSTRPWMVSTIDGLGRTRIVGPEDDRIVVGKVGDRGTSSRIRITGIVIIVTVVPSD